MTEKIYMSASPHKREDLSLGLSQYGQSVRFANPPQFAPEPDKFSPLVAPLKTLKFANHPDVRGQIESMDIGAQYWVFAMDINGMIPGKKSDKKDTVLLTTCRGEMPSIQKVSETAIDIYDRRKWEYGHIVFDNLCAPVKMRDSRIDQWTGFIERGYLSISTPLINLMTDMRVWKKIVDASDNSGKSDRSLDNPGATAGVDWSIFPDYLNLIYKTTGVKDLKLIWKNQSGKTWVASENGVQRGMVKDLSNHLRGFRAKTVRGIAQLPN